MEQQARKKELSVSAKRRTEAKTPTEEGATWECSMNNQRCGETARTRCQGWRQAGPGMRSSVAAEGARGRRPDVRGIANCQFSLGVQRDEPRT